MSNLIQLQDTIGSDHAFTTCVQFAPVFTFTAGSFVIGEDDKTGRKYFMQVAAPQLNLNRSALGATEMSTLDAMQRVNDGRITRDVVINEVGLYQLKLIADVTDGYPKSVRIRPQTATVARLATQDEMTRYIGLPEAKEEYLIGHITDSDIGVAVSRRVMRHHILVAGSTGSGKSNTANNLIHASEEMGACTFVFDHKPDYQNLSEPNDEAPGGRGLKKVTNYKLGKRGGKRSSNDIFVGASELDPGLLARTIFHLQGEQMQADTATDLFYKFSEYRSSIGEDAWSIQDFLLWVSSKEAAEITKDIQKNNLTATVRKIGRPRRIPEWIDGPTKRGMGSSAVNLKTIIKPGAVNVILIDGAGRDYGLFLSWFLGMVATWQRAEDKKVPIHHLIDEAQDIFNAGREMASAVGGKLEEQIRKGRSLNISFTICVQSAEAVPEGIRNNLNSQLIHRHNNYRQAKDSITRATEEQVRMTDSFGPGECLANIFGTNAVIHCQMRRAISNLTKEA